MSDPSYHSSMQYKSSLTEEEREREWLRIFNKEEYKKKYPEDYKKNYPKEYGKEISKSNQES